MCIEQGQVHECRRTYNEPKDINNGALKDFLFAQHFGKLTLLQQWTCRNIEEQCSQTEKYKKASGIKNL